MADETKFSEDEMKSLKNLQTNYLEIQDKFGQLAIARLNLQTQAKQLTTLEEQYKKDFVECQEKEKDLVDKLTEKYGQGTLDPKTGIFTPTEKK